MRFAWKGIRGIGMHLVYVCRCVRTYERPLHRRTQGCRGGGNAFDSALRQSLSLERRDTGVG